jgi:hypothetical protein
MRCHFIRVCCTTLSAVALTLVLLLSGCDAWTTAQGTAVRAATLDDSQTVDIPIDHDIYGSELPHALLGEILGGTGIPRGVAQLEGCSGVPAVVSTKAKKGTTIRQALDAFVVGNPGYQWLLEGGVVNLVPKNAPLALLNSRIHSFQLSTTDRQTTAGAILDDLVRLPEVRQRAAELELQPRVLQEFFLGVHKESPEPIKAVPIVLSLKNVSLREAFNSVVHAYGNTIWIYVEHECNGGKQYLVTMLRD